ncbi:MAG: 16S rRNA (guanine(966)-N(2))-methyltransferase RsmD [Desulfobacterales bacterium]|nr:16S rRNA (guanine(966)-N(2))-methyltransferase RsmD [Desulfobacterales bacterium]
MRLRIIAGQLKGKKIYTVPGKITRPTSDRLRETIFNILSFRIQEAIVLDLFAGTGALGIEALSRGAKFAVFIDNYKESLHVIAKNLRLCELDNKKTQIIKWNIIKNLDCIKSIQPAFDLVLMDPPYGRNLIEGVLMHLHHSDCLKKGSWIVVEHNLSEPIPQTLFEFEMKDQRKYGKSLVSFLTYKRDF